MKIDYIKLGNECFEDVSNHWMSDLSIVDKPAFTLGYTNGFKQAMRLISKEIENLEEKIDEEKWTDTKEEWCVELEHIMPKIKELKNMLNI